MTSVNHIIRFKQANNVNFPSESDNHLGNFNGCLEFRRKSSYNHESRQMRSVSSGVLAIIVDAWYIDTCIEEVGVRYGVHITQATDYSAFGAPLPGRAWYCSKQYRQGYQGSETDFDVTSGSYTTFYRELDVRLGRWLSLDPKSAQTPWESPYMSMSNNPISYTDVLGDRIIYGHDASRSVRRRLRREFRHAMRDPKFRERMKQYLGKEKDLVISDKQDVQWDHGNKEEVTATDIRNAKITNGEHESGDKDPKMDYLYWDIRKLQLPSSIDFYGGGVSINDHKTTDLLNSSHVIGNEYLMPMLDQIGLWLAAHPDKKIEITINNTAKQGEFHVDHDGILRSPKQITNERRKTMRSAFRSNSLIRMHHGNSRIKFTPPVMNAPNDKSVLMPK